jgi:alpha-tubulin suppressor-like RCC1 family protein
MRTQSRRPHTHYFLRTGAIVLSIACTEATAPPVATRLTFITQPASVTAATSVPDIVVAIQDVDGRTVTTATNDVTLAVDGSTGNPNGSLIGTTTVAAVNGVATFSKLSFMGQGINYALAATSPNLTTAISNKFTVVAGPPAQLAFTFQLQTVLANAVLPISISVQDAAGNTVFGATSRITLALAAGPTSGTLTGVTSVNAMNGVAIFSGLSITAAGTGYALAATSPGLASARSTEINVIIGPPLALTFTTQPATTLPGATITPAVVVRIRDAAGNAVTTWSDNVTVKIGQNNAHGTLSGTTTVAPVNGIAIFSDLRIDNAGEDYTLTAESANLSGTSDAFGVRIPPVFTAVIPGYFHSCGIVTTGAAYCWGANSDGQLGDGSFSTSVSLRAVAGGRSFANISAGRTHSCAVSNGAGYCWGTNGGALGNGGMATSPTPVAVSGVAVFGSVLAGYAHSCGVTPAGVGYCWGNNNTGAIGDGTQSVSTIPVQVSGGLTFSAISPGRYFTCGLTTGGAAYCWGVNDSGELGDGTTTNQRVPIAVKGGLAFSMVSAGGFHACGLTTAGKAYCWGSNAFGQLGDNTTNASSVPVAVATSLTFAMISAGNRHTCGVIPSGVAYCWGDNSSANLGDGTRENRFTPVGVAGGITFANVIAGRFHTCGVATDGTGYCWGSNGNGQLGDGTTLDRLSPVAVR